MNCFSQLCFRLLRARTHRQLPDALAAVVGFDPLTRHYRLGSEKRISWWLPRLPQLLVNSAQISPSVGFADVSPHGGRLELPALVNVGFDHFIVDGVYGIAGAWR